MATLALAVNMSRSMSTVYILNERVRLDTYTMVPTPHGSTAATSTLRTVILSLSSFTELAMLELLTHRTITCIAHMDEFG
jgi:hypothetical protein